MDGSRDPVVAPASHPHRNQFNPVLSNGLPADDTDHLGHFLRQGSQRNLGQAGLPALRGASTQSAYREPKAAGDSDNDASRTARNLSQSAGPIRVMSTAPKLAKDNMVKDLDRGMSGWSGAGSGRTHARATT